MTKKKNIEPTNGILTNTMNTNSKEFREFQLFLSERANALDSNQKLDIELMAIRIKMEDYLSTEVQRKDIIEIGEFLRLYIDKLEIKQNKLAHYIGLKPPNLSKILSGNRKINFELSFMLSQIFKLDPQIWMLIQVKNEFLELSDKKNKYYSKYKLEDLIRV